MIEHNPWIGPLYHPEGLNGQRLGIMGYSAWTEDDHINYTVQSVCQVVSKEWKASFFTSIPRYFDRECADFYNRVVFFEFVPCAIGGRIDRYKVATPEQASIGRERLLRIAEEQKMDKLLVFSVKAWCSLTEMPGLGAKERHPLGETGFQFARCQIADRQLTVIGLRHPQ